MNLPAVLFLCTGNSARSQMAEALLRHHAGDRFEVHSAGIDPQGINPLTIRVMEEIGIPLSGHRSKSIDEFLGKISIRHAIIVCESAERSCPRLYPFAVNRLSWHFPDPAAATGSVEERLASFRSIRDQIDRRIQDWLRLEKPE